MCTGYDPTTNEPVAVDGMEQRPMRWRSLTHLTRRPELLVGTGAMLGVIGRFIINAVAKQYLLAPIPIGTLLINLGGCLAIGVIQTLFLEFGALRREAQLFLAVGLCGGFTTFSTFSLETIQLLQAGHLGAALAYQALSVIGGILAVLLGIAIAQLCYQHRAGLRRRRT